MLQSIFHDIFQVPRFAGVCPANGLHSGYAHPQKHVSLCSNPMLREFLCPSCFLTNFQVHDEISQLWPSLLSLWLNDFKVFSFTLILGVWKGEEVNMYTNSCYLSRSSELLFNCLARLGTRSADGWPFFYVVKMLPAQNHTLSNIGAWINMDSGWDSDLAGLSNSDLSCFAKISSSHTQIIQWCWTLRRTHLLNTEADISSPNTSWSFKRGNWPGSLYDCHESS